MSRKFNFITIEWLRLYTKKRYELSQFNDWMRPNGPVGENYTQSKLRRTCVDF
jgi:hypothetical protein